MGIMQESEAPTWAGAVWPEAELLVGGAQGLPELLTALLVCREKLRDIPLHCHLLREWPGKPGQLVAELPGTLSQDFPGCCPRLEAAQPEASPQTVHIILIIILKLYILKNKKVS